MRDHNDPIGFPAISYPPRKNRGVFVFLAKYLHKCNL
nr:MAG TPA: hypothetical protein [Caudoviricetes sp.]